jgi:hypothetical protein
MTTFNYSFWPYHNNELILPRIQAAEVYQDCIPD